jgi:ATP-dependent helicase HrpA
LHYPAELPITERREEIIRAIQEHQVLVITGETGSGKSTQIPKMCIEAGRGVNRLIGCTQPRRIAAITLAGRVSEELREEGPRRVGYKIRFQDRTARTTRIKFMTDGILLAEAQRDRFFRAYDTIIVDEAHERTLNIDFLLGLIKKILPRRPDLKVIVTAATIDPEKFSAAFGNAPIIEVSGRTYPVEVRYRPMEETEDEEGETTYVDQAIAAVDSLKSGLSGSKRGDILIFMPTESDIRETVQRLEEKRYRHTLVLPLFGRMASSDQQRVFRLTPEDKIVVATNVAETSITIPRIRYVIDTGLARISQYNVRSRTQSLPVVPVSQSSADQRKGRCGRVEAGICIRLYAQEDYLQRMLYTPPEIQRSNLAEVILRMLFLRLGNIQDFPFLDPPSPAAIKDGFGVLKELGAVDEHRKLTRAGQTMARLPLDPRLARMLMQAHKEGALREMAILAAALSIQDPRERPMDKETQADQAHARFRDPRSDFVSLLKIWQAAWQGKFDPLASEAPLPRTDGNGRETGAAEASPRNVAESGIQSQSAPEPRLPSRGRLRRFCHDHFLSYRRMREWRDVHDEIRTILDELGELEINETPASYEAIHRCIVSGYLSQIGLRKEKNIYQATKNRQVMVFPGSGLFGKGGAWIVAAEQVQTSRLFARTVANIDPEWLEELGSHLCQSTYSEPHWEKNRGQVVAFERVTLYGLSIVERRKVNYGRINPLEAREIFIRSALVEGNVHGNYGFMEHNRDLIRQIEDLESKSRRRDLLVDEEALYRFYDQRVPNIADVRSFNKFLKDQSGDGLLRMTEADLLQSEPDFEALEQFPDALAAGEVDLPLRYAFRPGEEDDGVTAVIPAHTLPRLSEDMFEWLVPGLLSEKVTLLLKALPKSLRRQLVPVGETALRLVRCLEFREGNLYVQLSRRTRELTGVQVIPDQWDGADLPQHLRMRLEIIGPDGKILGTGRELAALKPLAAERHEDDLWDEARRIWERDGITSWDFGDLPRKVELGKDSLGVVRHGCLGIGVGSEEKTDGPALFDQSSSPSAALRLFVDPQQAKASSREGLMLLYQHAFASELKQLKKNWGFPDRMVSKLFFLGDRKKANQRLHDYLMREIFDLHDPQWPDRRKFEETVQGLKGCIGGLAQEMIEEVFEVVREREATRVRLERFRQMAAGNSLVLDRLRLLFKDLNELVPEHFPQHYRREDVQLLPRYLKALQIRGERVYVDPEKDRLKAEQLELHEKRLREMQGAISPTSDEETARLAYEFRWMLEEFKISLFAPEIRTRFRISAKRLEEKWQEWLSWKANNRL